MGYGFYSEGSSSNLQLDSDRPYSYYKVIASGTGTSPTIAGLDITKDLVFAKPSTGAGGLYCNVSPPSTTLSFSSSANYYVLRPVLVESPSTVTYGLRTYNLDGNLAFDSGFFGTGEDVILQVSTVVDAGQLVGNTASSSSVAYTGSDYSDHYANFNYGFYENVNYYFNGYFWSSPTTSVRFDSRLLFGAAYYYFRNPAVILVKVAIP